jgi:hypothetical protein
MKTNLNLSSNPQYLEAVAIRDKLVEALHLEQSIEAQHLERLNMLCVAPGQQFDDVERALDMANGRPAPAGNAALGQAIHESQGKQAVLQAGIERQEQRLADLAGNLSAAYCQERRAEHVTAIKQLRDGLAQVRDAIKAEHVVRESIKAAGYRDMLPGLHQMTFGEDSTEADALREISHYLAIHCGGLSEAKKVTGIALSSFEMFGVSGQVGQALTVSEVIGEMLRYHGKFDPCGAAVKASRMQQLAAIVG